MWDVLLLKHSSLFVSCSSFTEGPEFYLVTLGRGRKMEQLWSMADHSQHSWWLNSTEPDLTPSSVTSSLGPIFLLSPFTPHLTSLPAVPSLLPFFFFNSLFPAFRYPGAKPWLPLPLYHSLTLMVYLQLIHSKISISTIHIFRFLSPETGVNLASTINRKRGSFFHHTFNPHPDIAPERICP